MDPSSKKTEKKFFTILEMIIAIVAFIVFFIVTDFMAKLTMVIIGVGSLLKSIYNFKTMDKTNK